MVGKRQLRRRNKSGSSEVENNNLKRLKTEDDCPVNLKAAETRKKRVKSSAKVPLSSANKVNVKYGSLVPKDNVKTNVKNCHSQDADIKKDETVSKDEKLEIQNCFSSDTNDKFLKELSQFGLKKTSHQINLEHYKPTGEISRNLMHVFQKYSYGLKCQFHQQQAVRSPVVSVIKDFELYRTASPFDRRVTAMEWHPTRSNILAVGSKGGDIILWDTESVNKDKFVQGIGAAGSCQAMKFWPWDSDKVVSASINGTVTLHDFETKQGTVLADTMDSYDHWYCSLDVNRERYLVVAGRNGGILHMMSTEGRKVFEYRLHKNKITHVEFSPREEWLLCTASTDQTVQMWDVRYMKDRKSSLHVLHHDKPVNSAYFSHTDGCRLLTTDQSKQIRVYRAPFWHLEKTIEHPHRFFQHISPFKATWHPLQDLIVCGRYPDKNVEGSTGYELRTLDIFDADTGNIVSQLYSRGTDGLCPLNKFNKLGDSLASGMGFHILLWNRKQEISRKQSLLTEGMINSANYLGTQNLTSGRSNQRSRLRPPKQKKSKTEDVDELKKKIKTKTKEQKGHEKRK